MTGGFDLLVSADALVTDANATSEALVARLGLPEPSPRWLQDYPDTGYRAIFLRAQRSLKFAPTRVEIIAPLPDAPEDCRARAVLQDQGRRPMRTHATVISSSDCPALVEGLRARDVLHWIEPFEGDTIDRVWIGLDPDDPRKYSPEFDGGLRVEVIATSVLPLGEEIFAGPPDPPPDLAPSDAVRVVSHEFLVEDLEQVVSRLEGNLAWHPDSSVETDSGEGCRRLSMSLNIPHSAAFQLVEATNPDTVLGEYYARWGPGPFTTRIAVVNLDAKEDDLRSRSTPCERLRGTAQLPERLRIDPAATRGLLFEFVELSAA